MCQCRGVSPPQPSPSTRVSAFSSPPTCYGLRCQRQLQQLQLSVLRCGLEKTELNETRAPQAHPIRKARDDCSRVADVGFNSHPSSTSNLHFFDGTNLQARH